MATFKQYSQTLNDASEAFSIDSFTSDEIKVRVDGVLKSAGTHYNITSYTTNGGTVTWTSGNVPAENAVVRIYRITNTSSAKATYAAGSSVKAGDLNDNQTQLLRAIDEENDQFIQTWDVEPDAVTTTEIKDNTIVNANISPTAEIAVSKLADGAARQVLQTAADGTTVEWTDNVDIPGTLDVTGNTDLDGTLNVDGTTQLQATGVDGNFDVNSNKFTVISSSGNTSIAGTLTVTGASTLNGDVTNSGTSTLSTVDINGGAIDGTVIGANSAAAGSFTTVNASGTITGNVTGNVTGDLTGKASQLADAASVIHSEQAEHEADNSTYFTTLASDARYFNISSGETIKDGDTFPDNDTTIATTAAINDRIIDLVDDVGGFVPLASEAKFPAANPDVNNGAGTIVSIGVLGATYTPSGGTVTIPDSTLDNISGSNVSITGCGTTTLSAGFGCLVETTTTLHEYKFHRLTPKATEVTTVAGKATEIGRLGTTATVEDLGLLGTTDVVADMALLGTTDCIADMATIADTSNLITNIGTVAGIQANVTTVAGISSNVTTVAGINANVTTVAGNNANVTTVAGISGNVTTVAGNNSNVTTVAGKISDVESVADNIASVENFNDKYQIDDFSPSAPTTDGGGNAVAEGDLAYDSTAKRLKVYNGSSWESGVAGSSDLLNRGGGQMTGNITMSGSQTVDGRDLSVDGAKLDAIEASATADQTAAEIRTLVESATDSNVFTDADHTKLDGIAASANNYVHPNHSGEVTSTADGATVIADDTVDEANLKISNAGSDGQFLSKQSGNTGGLTWASVTQTDTTYSVSCVDGDNSDEEKIRLTAGGSGSGTDDIVLEAGTGLSVARSGDKITFTNTVTDTTLTNEAVQDVIGAMFSSNTETGITATYQDADGTIDLVVASQTDENFTSADHTKLDGIEASADVTDATNVNSAGAVMNSDLDGKGELLVGDGSGDPSALAVGSNGQFLKANSSEATGVEWATISTTDTTYSISCVDGDNSDEEKIRLTAGGSGSGTDDVVLEAGTGLSVARSGDKITFTNTVTDTNTQLTEEQVEDFVGGMVTGNTETGITVTYQDADGTLDFVVGTLNQDTTGSAATLGTARNFSLTGEITASDTSFNGSADCDIATTIASNVVDEDNLKVSNSPTNGYVLTAQSGNTGGLTWAAASAGTITALNNQTADRLTTIGATTTELDGEASLTFNDAATTGLISGRQITGRGFECPATVSDDWTIAAGNNAMFPGPMTVAATKTVTVPANRTLTIV